MARGYTVPTTFTAVDKFSGTINSMIGNTNKFERQMKRISVRSFEVARGFGTVGLAIATPLGLAVNEAIKFEASMANVATLIDTSVESISDMSDSILDISKSIPVPINELTASLYDVRSAGIDASEQFKVLETSSMLSVAGLSSVEEATNITTSAINAFASENLRASDITNILFKTVKAGKTTVAELSQSFGGIAPLIESSGVKLADFSAATAALTTTGTPASMAQTQLKSAISKLKGPTQEMQKVFKALGVTTDKELIAKYGTLGKSFKAVSGEIDKQGLSAKKTWGSVEALSGVTSLIGATNKTYIDTLKDMESGTDKLTEAFDKQSKTGKAGLQLAKNQFQSIAITLGNELLPVLNDVLKSVTPMVKRFGAWAKNNKPLLGTIIKTTAAIAALSLGISGVAYVVGGLTKALSIVGGPMTLLIAGVGLLAGAYVTLDNVYNRSNRSMEIGADATRMAKINTIDQRLEVDRLFQALENSAIGTDKYKTALDALEKIQPGVTERFKLNIEGQANLKDAYDATTKSIIKQARQQALLDKAKESIRSAELAKAEGPGFMDKFLEATQRAYLGGMAFKTQEEINQDRVAGFEQDAQEALKQREEVINPAKLFSILGGQLQQQVEVIINNNSDSEVSTDTSGLAMGSTTSTN